jgi:hypothetical protein
MRGYDDHLFAQSSLVKRHDKFMTSVGNDYLDALKRSLYVFANCNIK